MLALAAAVALVPLLAACKDIDRAQWGNDPFRTGEAASRARSLAPDSTSTARTTRNRTIRTTTTTTTTVTNPADTSGVEAGANAGSRRSDTASVVVFTDPSTCWILVVDGNSHRGCGNATITDTRGERAGRATKLSGPSPIELQLLVGGRTVESDQVQGDGRYVTVQG
jgi:hypothetical protein